MPFIRRRSPWSLLFHEREIDVNEAEFNAWLQAWIKDRQSVPGLQAMFPHVPAEDREFLFSGITPEEWELDRINAERTESQTEPIASLDEMADE